MNVPLVEVEDIKTGRGGGKREKGERYSKYVSAFAGHVEWIKEQISESKDSYARFKVIDLAKSMGLQLKVNDKGPGLHSTSLYWGVKYAAFYKGFVVTTGQTKANEPILAFRLRTNDDKLPPSLIKGEGSGDGDEGNEENGNVDEGKETNEE